jgi:hypothetical protein
MKNLLKKAQKTKMTKMNNLIILCNHVRPLIQTPYNRPRNDQLGLKLPYKTQKDSRSQKEHSEKSKKPKRFSSYAAYMTKLLDEEPTTFEEAVQKKQWKEAMTEEHQSIMKNDVWEIVPRPKEKSVVTSSGYIRSNMQQTKAWINIKQGS